MIELLVFEHQRHEHPGNIKKIAKEQEVRLNVVPLWQTNFSRGDLPTIWSLEGMDGLLIMGGSMGVNDEAEDFPTRTMELRTIQAAYGRIPIIGTCLGAQEIAKVLGADIYQNRVGDRIAKEIGFDFVTFTDEGSRERLYKGLESPLLVLQWHGDAFTLPSGANRLATSPVCENQAFVIREGQRLLAYAQLFHLEITSDMMPDWISENKQWIHDGIEVDERGLIRLSKKNEPILEKESKIVWTNLIDEMREQAKARGKYH